MDVKDGVPRDKALVEIGYPAPPLPVRSDSDGYTALHWLSEE